MLTTIERRLATLAAPDMTIRLGDIASVADSHKASRPRAIGRLDVLEKLQLVERASPTSWRFEDGWQQALKDLGERGDIIKRLHGAMEASSSRRDRTHS